MASSSFSLMGVLLAVLVSPLILPPLILIMLGTLAWSVIFDRFKASYNGKVTKDMLPPAPEEHTLVTRDGVTLRYLTTKIKSHGDADSAPPAAPGKIVLFCNPLGAQGFRSWASVGAAVGDAWGPGTTFICWDYRGFFESEDPKRLRNICVRNHAEDGAEVLKAVVGAAGGADLLVGHSMGVQVALEFALLYPEKIDAMVLLNGTYGHALQTGLQPLVKLPFVGDLICMVLRMLLRNGQEKRLDMLRKVAEPFVGTIFRLVNRLFGSKELAKVFEDKDYMLHIWNGYLGGICSNTKTMKAFLRGFQDLDAHTTAHLMHQLGHPTLLIAGLWDVFTPAYNMAVMRRAMPNTRLIIDMFSSHFSCVEHPERVMGEVAHFLKEERPKMKRLSTFNFKKQE